ncbi:hypothetical protein RHMOL_Rhmol06G0311200 [Rhododendron molle]|uniref:Uncharacterized protein n=1 Tax=Rhododendron molle TaxID=49168 RepID=A0ACC0NJL3_RHOML|nr:hypothetical protein RHMOL_Rhmol06G0311200 [Rhododendron molle]
MKRIFHVGENSSMASMLATVVSECERALSAGETKRCVGPLNRGSSCRLELLSTTITTSSSAGSSHLHRASYLAGYGAGVDDLDVHMLSACGRRVTTEPFRIISEGHCRPFCLLRTPPPRGSGCNGATSSSCSSTCSLAGGTRVAA